MAGAGAQILNYGETLLAARDKAQFATAGTSILKASNEALAGFDTDPDYGTYDQRYRAQMKSAVEAASKGLGNNEDRATFVAQAGQEIERGAAQAGKMTRVKTVNAEVGAVENLTDTNRTLAVNALSPEDREKASQLIAAGWDGLVAKGYIDAPTAAAKKRAAADQISYDIIDRDVVAGNLEAAAAHLKQFLPRMDEKHATQAAENIRIRQAGLDAEKRRVAAEGRAEQAHQFALQKDQLGAAEQSLNAGAGTVQDRLDIAKQYHDLGDESKAAEWVQKGAEFSAVQGSRDFTLPQMDTTIAALTAKQGSKEGLTPLEAAQLNGLKGQRNQSASRLNQPGGALLQLQYATGRPTTPLDLHDPASLVQRGNEAAAAARTYGRAAIEPLLPEELKPLQDLLASGDVKQKAQALQIIAGFRNPAVVAGAARQITGEGDGAFRVAATRILSIGGRDVAMHILGGADALKANPNVWQKPSDSGTGKLVSAEDDAQALFAEYIPALAALGPTAARDTYEASKAFYASKMTAAGQTQFSHGAWRTAVEAVIGGYSQGGTRYGGTADFQGQRVVVPQGWTGEGLFRRIARAHAEDWLAASGQRNPIWPDGSKVYTAQLRNLVPVWMGGTTYGFRSPRTNNFLPAEDGRPFTIDAAKVPWR